MPKKAPVSKKTSVKTTSKATAKAPSKATGSKRAAPKPASKAPTNKASASKTPTKKTVKSAVKPKTTPTKKPTKQQAKPPKTQVAAKHTTASGGANLSTMGIPHYVTLQGEEYMNEKQRQHIERILLAWRQSLMEEVDRTVTHMKDEAANFPDSIDRASQEEEFSLELRTRDRERKLIKKIEDALERLREDEFGYCEACGIEIGIARLEARPTATLCIDCKTLAEIKEKQTVGG